MFTLAVGLLAPRYDLRNLLIAGAALMICTGLAFPQAEAVGFLIAVAFFGTINPSTGDIGVLIPLEHAMLTAGVADHERTRTFARYSLIGALSMAVGALAAAAPDFLVGAGFTRLGAFRAMFYAYAVLGLASAAIYTCLPHAHAEQRPPAAPLKESRGVVYKLAALFSLDAFAGGFCRAVADGGLAVRALSYVARRRRACSSSGPACSPRFPIRWPPISPNTSAS